MKQFRIYNQTVTADEIEDALFKMREMNLPLSDWSIRKLNKTFNIPSLVIRQLAKEAQVPIQIQTKNLIGKTYTYNGQVFTVRKIVGRHIDNLGNHYLTVKTWDGETEFTESFLNKEINTNLFK
jgi:hypothetical protein